MPPLDYEAISLILEESFNKASRDFPAIAITKSLNNHQIELLHQVFNSKTSAYRETLLGCILAKLSDPSIDVTLPYVSHGVKAFNGRTLDERVVNPFLHSKQIPCSKGPYLSVFRRNVRFEPATRSGLKDKPGYDAFFGMVEMIGYEPNDRLELLLEMVLREFLRMREGSVIELARPQRISLSQYEKLISGLIATPSGGALPVLLVVATLKALNECYRLGWTIDAQGINVSDKASGAGGDITVRKNDMVLLILEVTERPVEKSRVEATFRTKIAQLGIKDYLFMVDLSKVDSHARHQAHNYFAQGHEINFLDIKNWMVSILATLGGGGREVFTKNLLDLLDSPATPKSAKVAWNEAIFSLSSSTPS